MLSRILLCVLCVLGLAACADDAPTADEEVGNDLTTTTASTATSAGPTGTATSAPPAPPTTARSATSQPRSAANQRTRTDTSGFELTITVGGTLRYRADEDITLNLVVKNVSRSTLQYDSNDTQNFVIAPREGGQGPSWRNDDCRKARDQSFRSPALDLEPGESVTFQSVYPVTRVPGSSEDGRSCRLPPGDYAAFGKIEWCPPGSVGADRSCDATKTRAVSAPGVPITIG